jgi:hypothetical protein
VALFGSYRLTPATVRGLLEPGQPHDHVESIEQLLRVRVQIELEIAYRVAPVRENRDLLVQLVALGLEHLEQAPFRLLVIGLYEGKAFIRGGLVELQAPLEGQEALAGDVFASAVLTRATRLSPIDAQGEGTLYESRAEARRSRRRRFAVGMEGGKRHVAADEDLAPAQRADVLHDHMELRDVGWDDCVFHGQSVPRGRQ